MRYTLKRKLLKEGNTKTLTLFKTTCYVMFCCRYVLKHLNLNDLHHLEQELKSFWRTKQWSVRESSILLINKRNKTGSRRDP